MIDDIEEVLRFNQTIPRPDRVKYCMKKPVKGLCFKEMLLEINNKKRERGSKRGNQREHEKNDDKE